MMETKDSNLEPRAANIFAEYEVERYQYSLAISAKRIADLLESIIDIRYNAPALRTRGDD